MSVQGAISRTGEDAQAVWTTNYKIYVLVVLTAVYTSNYADRMILSVLLPAIQAEFGASDSAMGLLSGAAFAIFYATLGVPIAMLADRSNRKMIIAISAAIWSIMTAVCGLATSFTQLAIARIGVGVGEAGGSPPSHSIIADLFSQKSRGTALAIYSLGVPFGLLIGLYGGAQIGEAYGWKVAFFALGLPGLLLAALVWFTVREPARGAIEGHADSGDAPPILEVARFMARQRSLVHTFIGATLTTIVGYAGVTWWPTFIVRTHGLSISDMSLFLGLVFGVATGLGVFAGGYLADALARRDVRWIAWVVMVAIVIGLPFGLATYLTESSTVVFLLIGVPAFAGGFYLSPTFALTQSLVKVRMRTVASALLLFVINLIGMTLGPWLTGALSDVWKPEFGDQSLRYALLAVMAFNVWAAFHYWRAGATLAEDLKRATSAER